MLPIMLQADIASANALKTPYTFHREYKNMILTTVELYYGNHYAWVLATAYQG